MLDDLKEKVESEDEAINWKCAQLSYMLYIHNIMLEIRNKKLMIANKKLSLTNIEKEVKKHEKRI